MPNQTITIEFTYQQAELYKEFCRHYKEFEIMLKEGLFNFKNGKAIIHRDKDGILRKISIEKVAYKC